MDSQNENLNTLSDKAPGEAAAHKFPQGEKWQRLLEAETQIESLELDHQRVRAEIDKLSGASLLNLLYSVAGNKEERLDSARKEDESLQEQLDHLRAELEGLHRELASVRPSGTEQENG